MEKLPVISVIIPCYNYASYLPSAIESALNQEGNNFQTEIIVVDDGSVDNTREVANKYPDKTKYIYQNNMGLSSARNTGIKAASGDFVIFLDADDILQPTVIKTHLENFAANPDTDLGICHCLCENTDTKSFHLWNLKAENLDLHLCYGNIAPVHAFMTRKKTIDEVGFFDIERKACEDYDYWLRCSLLSKRFKANPNSFVVYKKHGDSMSSQYISQYIQDTTVKLEIDDYLSNEKKFLDSRKFTGWMAHAAGILSSTRALGKDYYDFKLELANHAAVSLLKGVREYNKNRNVDRVINRTERYYATDFFINAQTIRDQGVSAMENALALLSAHYPHLAEMSLEKLKASRTSLGLQLMSDFSNIMPQLEAYAKQNSLKRPNDE